MRWIKMYFMEFYRLQIVASWPLFILIWIYIHWILPFTNDVMFAVHSKIQNLWHKMRIGNRGNLKKRWLDCFNWLINIFGVNVILKNLKLLWRKIWKKNTHSHKKQNKPKQWMYICKWKPEQWNIRCLFKLITFK